MTKLTKKQIKENKIAEMKEELKNLIEKNGNVVYTKLLHVSRSGMMRALDLFLEDGTCITDEVIEIGGYTYHNNTCGLKVTGCGMDMGFSVVYNLSTALHGHNDRGGYVISQRWL